MENIIENNRLIAEFMGMSRTGENVHGQIEYDWKGCPANQIWPFEDAPPFNTSWDWLMPVVEKSEQDGFEVAISSQLEYRDDDHSIVIHQDVEITDSVNLISTYTSESKIQSVYMAVVDFIKTTSGQAIDSTKNK